MKKHITFLIGFSLLLSGSLLNGAGHYAAPTYTEGVIRAPDSSSSYPDDKSRDLLFKAIANENMSAVEQLVKEKPHFLRQRYKGENTPLFIAASYGKDLMVALILAHPIGKNSVNLAGSKNTFPLCAAVKGMNHEGIKKEEKERYKNIIVSLLDAGAQENVCSVEGQKIINNIKKEVAKKTTNIIGGGEIPSAIIGQYMYGTTAQERAADEKWEKERQAGVQKAASKAAEKAKQKSGKVAPVDSGVKSLDEPE